MSEEPLPPPDTYTNVFRHLIERLWIKHRKYGTSYQERTDQWMLSRLWGEYVELKNELEFSIHYRIIEEALDVAIVALLIADNHLRSMSGDGEE